MLAICLLRCQVASLTMHDILISTLEYSLHKAGTLKLRLLELGNLQNKKWIGSMIQLWSFGCGVEEESTTWTFSKPSLPPLDSLTPVFILSPTRPMTPPIP